MWEHPKFDAGLVAILKCNESKLRIARALSPALKRDTTFLDFINQAIKSYRCGTVIACPQINLLEQRLHKKRLDVQVMNTGVSGFGKPNVISTQLVLLFVTIDIIKNHL